MINTDSIRLCIIIAIIIGILVAIGFLYAWDLYKPIGKALRKLSGKQKCQVVGFSAPFIVFIGLKLVSEKFRDWHNQLYLGWGIVMIIIMLLIGLALYGMLYLTTGKWVEHGPDDQDVFLKK